MGYKHETVDFIETETKDISIMVLANEGDPPPHVVDGIPVTPELAQFCAEIRKFNRYVKFGLGSRARFAYANSKRIWEELHVYMEGHTYAMAKIGYRDYSIRSNLGLSKYMVYARTINNEKFATHNDQYNMATAEAIERAIKNVKKYIRPYTPVECASLSFDSVRSKFTSVVQGASSTLRTARSDVIDSTHLRNELFHMLDVGYKFLAIELREKIVQWREKYNEDQVARGRALHVYYVNIRLHHEEMMCDVILVLDANDRYSLDANTPVVTYRMEELPEHIGGGVAALSMVDDDHYVDGVGLRVDSTTFWVQR